MVKVGPQAAGVAISFGVPSAFRTVPAAPVSQGAATCTGMGNAADCWPPSWTVTGMAAPLGVPKGIANTTSPGEAERIGAGIPATNTLRLPNEVGKGWSGAAATVTGVSGPNPPPRTRTISPTPNAGGGVLSRRSKASATHAALGCWLRSMGTRVPLLMTAEAPPSGLAEKEVTVLPGKRSEEHT